MLWPTRFLADRKRSLTRTLHPDPYQRIDPVRGTWKRRAYLAHLPLRKALARAGVELVRVVDDRARADGSDVPALAETMVGLERLDNLHACVRDVLEQNVPGDLLEAGVWRGGASIFMRGALEAYGDEGRIVWAADSFEGARHLWQRSASPVQNCACGIQMSG